MLELNLVSRILSEKFPDKLITGRINPNHGFNPLSSPDILFLSKVDLNRITPFTQNLPLGSISFSKEPFSNVLTSDNNVIFSDRKLQILQQRAIQFAETEWRNEVKETGGKNRSFRIDQYAKNAGFGVGGEWCGFFAAFNYSQSGFKFPASLAGMRKSRDFFLYRQFTNRSTEKNAQMEKLRETHKKEGCERQFFMVKESPSIEYIKGYNKVFNNYDINANTFEYNKLPIRTGDIVLFYPGHVGMVVSYNKNSGKLVTIEGNTSGKTVTGKNGNGIVTHHEYDLSKARVREKVSGFGRPAAGDFQ